VVKEQWELGDREGDNRHRHVWKWFHTFPCMAHRLLRRTSLAPLSSHFLPFSDPEMGVNRLKKVARECGDETHQSNLRHATVMHNEIVFWLDRNSEGPKLSSKKCQLQRDFMECISQTSKVVEETTLMRQEVKDDECS